MREFCASPGSMCPAHACFGNWSIFNWHYCVACMAAPLGMPTKIGGVPILYGLCGALCCKNNPVAPVSATAVRMVVAGDRWCASLTSCPIFRLTMCTCLMSQSLGLFHILPFIVKVCVVSLRCPCIFPPHIILLCPMRTLNLRYQQYPLGSIGTDSVVIVALGGFGDLVPCLLASRTFVTTRYFTCVTSALLVSTNFFFMAMRSATMLWSAVAASARFSSDVAISVVSWASWAILHPDSPDTRCCSHISWYSASKWRLKICPFFVGVSLFSPLLVCLSVHVGCVDKVKFRLQYLFCRKQVFPVISILYGIINEFEKDVNRTWMIKWFVDAWFISFEIGNCDVALLIHHTTF